jgi:TolB protein
MPDGKAVLFASKRSGRSQIWVVDADGTHPRRVHASDASDHGRIAPNASGTRLCFSSDRGGENAIYVLDLRTGEVTGVSDPAWWSFGPTWSARDRIAYFSRKGGNHINLWTIRADQVATRGSSPIGRARADSPGGRPTARPWPSPPMAARAPISCSS